MKKENGRVLGRVLSREQTAAVSGGTGATSDTCTPSLDGTGTGADASSPSHEHTYPFPTTIGRDSGVWGEGDKPMN